MKRIMVLASGRGSNFQSILDHINANVLQNAVIAIVISNRLGARVVELARNNNIQAFEIEGVTSRKFLSREKKESARIAFDDEVLSIAKRNEVDIVVLAGFDQILSDVLVEKFENKILNIHPAYDIARFGGKNMVGRRVHEQVLASGEKYTGCTVHLVTKKY